MLSLFVLTEDIEWEDMLIGKCDIGIKPEYGKLIFDIILDNMYSNNYERTWTFSHSN